jgi:serine O-acetyltransferase
MKKRNNPPGFFATLREDMRATGIRRPNIPVMLFLLLARPGFLAVFLHRSAAACYPYGMIGRVLGKTFWRLNVLFNSCDIRPQAKIGPGLNLSHPFGVVIGIAEIGKNATIMQNVTLGLRNVTANPDDMGARPRVGDNVVIYAGAVLVGSIRIGDGAWIGANAVVLKDVPEHCLAAGVPARIIKRPKQNSHD